MANEGATQHEANTEETRMIISTPSRQMVAMRRDMNVTDIIQMEKKPVLVRIERAERVVGDKGKPIKHCRYCTLALHTFGEQRTCATLPITRYVCAQRKWTLAPLPHTYMLAT